MKVEPKCINCRYRVLSEKVYCEKLGKQDFESGFERAEAADALPTKPQCFKGPIPKKKSKVRQLKEKP